MSNLKTAIFGMALAFVGSASASACNTGDVYCDNGYRYECQCYTTEGCRYYQYGRCSAFKSEDPCAPFGIWAAPANACMRNIGVRS